MTHKDTVRLDKWEREENARLNRVPLLIRLDRELKKLFTNHPVKKGWN